MKSKKEERKGIKVVPKAKEPIRRSARVTGAKDQRLASILNSSAEWTQGGFDISSRPNVMADAMEQIQGASFSKETVHVRRKPATKGGNMKE
mmetsp:Transcript_5390/g.8374  ORF Transcript_5390/g.8374 Transcript_5390/m.8374 type:complete len:92 (-) Transcript_5390:637-912(-)|eukprot:CAMPEP_0184652552 /NCGR_PEP_ID=MMETSP0308-20130426/10248_1 /TAXON_ID=38269 /ORGANISM="Gloeochaete witrockiana, Strain SAG 46.84" /LENGTH=91 /DNA_ID=CAMNT_0027087493 /DNA_START=78 /DNA_END=353 /DNA_ORIENTATION=-